MKAYLRTLPARGGATLGARDLTLDVPDTTELRTGATVSGIVSHRNSGIEDAYVEASYPRVELLLGIGNLEFGATVIEPSRGVPGLFPVGTRVVFTVVG